MTQTTLHIDSSARRDGSVTRELTSEIIEKIGGTILRRDLADGLPLINEAWVGANFTAEAERTDAQREQLSLSDTLVEELEAADTIVIGLPIYNFGIPAGLKAWIDLVARAGRTFKYTSEGPQGLLTGKRVIVAVASGGTQVGSDLDFATGYLRHVLGFIGLEDVTFVSADQLAKDADASLSHARQGIEALAA